MKHIQEYVEKIKDELEDAKDYAEKAAYWKYEGNASRQKYYYEMANDELKHAKMIHDLAVEDINKMKEQGYTAPEKMQEAWMLSHAEYVDKAAWVKQILTM